MAVIESTKNETSIGFMNDHSKTKKVLIEELTFLRKEVSENEKAFKRLHREIASLEKGLQQTEQLQQQVTTLEEALATAKTQLIQSQNAVATQKKELSNLELSLTNTQVAYESELDRLKAENARGPKQFEREQILQHNISRQQKIIRILKCRVLSYEKHTAPENDEFKKKVRNKAKMSRSQLVQFLENFVAALKTGDAKISKGNDTIVLSPLTDIRLYAKAAAKRNEHKFKIELSWPQMDLAIDTLNPGAFDGGSPTHPKNTQ